MEVNITINDLKKLCDLANIDYNSSDTKKILKKKVLKYLNKYTYPPRYLRGLTQDDKFTKMFEIRYHILRKKNNSKKNSYKSSIIDKKYSNTKKSKYTKKWNSKYKNSKSLKSKSKISGVPLYILKKVYNKGLSAWKGSSHRPGAKQHQWGVSRVNSFLTCGKTWYFPDHKLAQEAMKKSKKARKFWSKKNCVKSRMGKRTKSR